MATALDWGHELVTPDGRTIRVPQNIFPLLRKLGALQNNKPRLNNTIYQLLEPQYDSLALGLRMMLGEDLSGPAWLQCNCRECREKRPYRDAGIADQAVAEVKAKRKRVA